MHNFQFKSTLSKKSYLPRSLLLLRLHQSLPAAKGLVKAARKMTDVFVVHETQFQRSGDQGAVNLASNPEGESQDLLIAPSGTVTRSISPTPSSPSDKMDKVTLAFVYQLVKEVMPKFLSLATTEERLTNYESMVKGQTPICSRPAY